MYKQRKKISDKEKKRAREREAKYFLIKINAI